mgnify:FL=1
MCGRVAAPEWLCHWFFHVVRRMARNALLWECLLAARHGVVMLAVHARHKDALVAAFEPVYARFRLEKDTQGVNLAEVRRRVLVK